MKSFFPSVSKFGHVNGKLVNAMLGRNARPLLVGIFERILPVIGVRTSPFRMSIICKMIARFVFLHRTQGSKGLVLHLKAVTVLFQQCLGGHRLRDTSGLKSRVSRRGMGLPLVIPSQDRALIRAGDVKIIRFYMTIFNIYRIIEFPGKVNLSTITAPFNGDSNHPYYKMVLGFVPAFVAGLKKAHALPNLKGRQLLSDVIPRSGPGTAGPLISSDPFVMLLTARRLRALGLESHLTYFLRRFGSVSIPGLMDGHILRSFQAAASLPNLPFLPSEEICLGRLGFKEEAAGKVRVFAMVDAWTQWSLSPLHDGIFSALRKLPMDGTFNQMAPLAFARDWPSAYSLDLTAATDRLPMDIQVELLAGLFDRDLALHWRELLVSRDYLAASDKYHLMEPIRYAVGQPMGALSSWASLAITHHFIVQCAAWIAGVTPPGTLYTHYAVLGDDLVIGDYAVSRVYLRICKVLGVEIGLHKSLLSRKGTALEFAKRTFFKGTDVSPVPLLEFFDANVGLPSAMAFAHKYGLPLTRLLKAFGYGFRVLGSLYKHIGVLNGRVRLLYMAYQVPVLTESDDSFEHFLSIGNPKVPVEPDLIQNMISSFSSRVGKSLTRIAGEPLLGVLIRSAVDQRMEALTRMRLVSLILDTQPAGPVGFVDPLAKPISYIFGNPLERVFRSDIPIGLRRQAVFKPFTVWIPDPSMFDNIVDTLKSWRKALYLIVMAQFYYADKRRSEQLSDLLYKVSLFPRMKTLNVAYPRLIGFLKELDGYSQLNSSFSREEAEPRVILDSTHLRLWRAWTLAIRSAIRSRKASK